MNKVFLIGNLTRDPELTETPNGVAVCKMSIAVNRDYENADGNRDVDFFNITVWRGRAENCGKYLVKGSKVAIAGTLQNRSYEDKDGITRYITDVVATDVEFLSARRTNENGDNLPGAERYDKPAPKDDASASSDTPPAGLSAIDDKQLPF